MVDDAVTPQEDDVANQEISCPACGARNRVPLAVSGRPRCGTCQRDLPWLSDVSAAELDDVIERSTVPLLVDLWAPWCGPCVAVAPVLKQLSVDRAGSLRVLKVNVDDEPSVSARLGVQGIPTMVLFDGGAEIGRQVGALPAARLNAWIDSVLGAGAR